METLLGRHLCSGDTLRLKAVGGLCNRLQAILSYRAVYGNIDVIWESSDVVSHAQFTDVFEPVEGVRFITGQWDREDWAICPNAPADWVSLHALLKPLSPIAERITTIQNALGPYYLAVHARRTDHTPLVTDLIKDQCTTDEDLRNFIITWPLGPVYLATDNGDTQKQWLANPKVVVGHSLQGTEKQGLDDHHRNGTLAEAVVDLFVCSNATRFMGTKHSSFSETIERLRATYFWLKP